MKYVLFVIALLALSACESAPKKPHPIQDIGCSMGKVIGFGLSGEIALALDCKNEMAINDAIFDALVKVNVCQAPPENPAIMSLTAKDSFGQRLCGNVARMAFMALTAEKFAEWQCSGGDAKEQLFEKVDELCARLRI
jgi:hypothetical protein